MVLFDNFEILSKNNTIIFLASTDALTVQKINSTGDIVWSKVTTNTPSKYLF